MTKEKLRNEAREYLTEHSEYSEVFEETFVAVDTLTAMVDFAEPREKQIQIDAEQIRALQKQNGELTDKVNELEAQIEKMKCCENCRYCNKWGEANGNSPNCKKCNWVSNWKLRR